MVHHIVGTGEIVGHQHELLGRRALGRVLLPRLRFLPAIVHLLDEPPDVIAHRPASSKADLFRRDQTPGLRQEHEARLHQALDEFPDV